MEMTMMTTLQTNTEKLDKNRYFTFNNSDNVLINDDDNGNNNNSNNTNIQNFDDLLIRIN